MLFQVLTEREETASIVIASSDQAFSGWTKTFTDPGLGAAIIDRLTFAGLIVRTGTHSWRLAHAKAQRDSRP
jgi:DNA replication protein DnaC